MSTLKDLLIAFQYNPNLSAAARLALIAISQHNNGGIVTRTVDRQLVQDVVGIPDHLADIGLDELRERGIVFTDEYGTWVTCFPEWEDQWFDAIRAAHPTTRQRVGVGLRRAVYARDGYECRECAARTPLSIDHIMPISKGGLTVIENLQTLCAPCNNRKSDRVSS